jgi:cob(I)alamin adenosyltransferase
VPRIYTRTGDGGQTGLVDGSRTSKADPRVDLYGEVDELNSALGLATTALDLPLLAGLATDLARIQADLFELGALLADPGRCQRLVAGESEDPAVDGAALEPVIDRLGADLPPLRAFILPGGQPAAAALHLARSICRRAERKLVTLRDSGTALPESALIYLNRLSDLLFVAARHVNHAAGRDDVLWPGRRAKD